HYLTSGGAGNAEEEMESEEASFARDDRGEFMPLEPKNFREAGLTDSQVEELILKSLLVRGDVEGRQIADQIKLPFGLLEELLRRLKQEQLVVYRDAAQVNDYQYQLTDM